jgi:PAS domain S-box-containing protein
MTGILFLQLVAAVVSVGLASGMLARDHELAPNRLIASFLFCNAFWAVCEFYLIQTTDPAIALANYRLMTLGWMPLGLLCMHGSLELSSMPEHRLARLTPFFYSAIACVVVISIGTDWIIADAVLSSPGHWQPVFGLGFVVAYVLMAAPVITILVCWKGLMSLPGHDGAHRLATVIFFGMSSALVTGTVTSVLMPIFGFEPVALTTILVAVVGFAAAWTLRRYGHSLISPEAFAREIFDTLEDGVIVVGKDGLIRDANRAFIQMLGHVDVSIVGHDVKRWVPEFPVDLEGFEIPTFMEMRDHAGEVFPTVVSPPVPLTTRGRAIGHIILIRDRREVVLLQRQLAVSGRLAAVGDLSKSISESIRGPAAATRLQLERLGSDWQAMVNSLEARGRLEPCRESVLEGLELIQECIEGVDRVTSIVQEVGNFSEESQLAGFSCHSLAEIVECGVRISSAQAKPHVDVETCLDPDVRVMGNRSELERVVTNLLVNAFHAFEGSRRRSAHLVIAAAAQGDRALLHVEDDGCGITHEALERIFDPFFTTKPVGKGTGLGLAISYHIIRKHGGQIRVSSIENRGTSVAVELPRYLPDVDQSIP